MTMVSNAAFFSIVIIAAIIGLANLGVNVTPLLAGAGIMGVAEGFGAQTLVLDMITGLFILIENTMAVGDWNKINGLRGGVESLNLGSVYMRDIDDTVNSIIFSQIYSVQNMSRQCGIALRKIRIPYDMPIDHAMTLMRDTAEDLRRDSGMHDLMW
ncbi:putative MscS family protein YkuT [Porphyridium purpureum]|uniref:Putative MscS family protein YkuT n=1 Tax=Porphyridium purpureum TaxID=35688 RepID=A0A5J4Z7P6_PORPP|nr:putative MscS family protein YkuT [Porphyridium purpureum]|eukprot:POR6849..scf295_1